MKPAECSPRKEDGQGDFTGDPAHADTSLKKRRITTKNSASKRAEKERGSILFMLHFS
jgi:hypothetical protein